jgi:salicylate hydroxylase
LRHRLAEKLSYKIALGQGFGMGLEDAVALGVLLPKTTHVSAVETRLAAYERLRKERAEFVARESYEQQHVPAKRGLYLRSKSHSTSVLILWYKSF